MCLLVIEIILFNIVMPPIRLTVRVHWFGFVFQVSEIASFIFGFASQVCHILHDSTVKAERSLSHNLARVFPLLQVALPWTWALLCCLCVDAASAWVLLWCSGGEESACSTGDLASISGLGRSPGGGHVNPLQYSCLENPHRQRSLADYSPWGYKDLDTAECLTQTHTECP